MPEVLTVVFYQQICTANSHFELLVRAIPWVALAKELFKIDTKWMKTGWAVSCHGNKYSYLMNFNKLNGKTFKK